MDPSANQKEKGDDARVDEKQKLPQGPAQQAHVNATPRRN